VYFVLSARLRPGREEIVEPPRPSEVPPVDEGAEADEDAEVAAGAEHDAAGAEPVPAPARDEAEPVAATARDEAEPVAATSADSSRADGSDHRPE